MRTKGFSTCSQCGGAHQRFAPICTACDSLNRLNARATRQCALCGGQIGVKRSQTANHSRYCSWECATAVGAVRVQAMRLVHSHIRRGLIPPASSLKCVDCGEDALHYEHRHYTRPLEVEATCRSCNYKRGPAEDIASAVRKHFKTRLSIHSFICDWRRRRESDRDYDPRSALSSPRGAARLIEDVGGDMEFARLLGLEESPWLQQRINNWKRRGIPARVRVEHYDKIQELLKRFREPANA